MFQIWWVGVRKGQLMIQSTQDSPILLDQIMHAHWVDRAREMAGAQRE
jgi:hypothetical protein